MMLPKKYTCLKQNEFRSDNYKLIPIRYEDRIKIMNWRNEQLYHLRQGSPISEKDQDHYFSTAVRKAFNQEKPDQLLFSYMENNLCIGYGGLVHINWIDKNAEISFVMDTQLETEYFTTHWTIFLGLIEELAFKVLKFRKISTFAFDIRPQLYAPFENSGFIKEATLKEHCFLNGIYKDVIIHSKFNTK